jgi:hypothetical protein
MLVRQEYTSPLIDTLGSDTLIQDRRLAELDHCGDKANNPSA